MWECCSENYTSMQQSNFHIHTMKHHYVRKASIYCLMERKKWPKIIICVLSEFAFIWKRTWKRGLPAWKLPVCTLYLHSPEVLLSVECLPSISPAVVVHRWEINTNCIYNAVLHEISRIGGSPFRQTSKRKISMQNSRKHKLSCWSIPSGWKLVPTTHQPKNE